MKRESYQKPEPVEPASSIDLRQLYRVLLEKWWLIALLCILGGAAGYLYMDQQPAVYHARAVLQVQVEEAKFAGIEDVARQDLSAGEVLNTIVANINNSAVLRRVVRTNNLATDPLFWQEPGKSMSEEEAMRTLNQMVNCQLRKDTRLIDIKVTHAVPAMAQKLANSIAQEYIRQILDQRFSTARVANEMLSEEERKLEAKLAASEKALQAYKQEKQAVSLEERQNIVIDKLKEFNKGYTDAKAARLRLEADLGEIRSMSNRVDALLALPSLLTDPAVAELRQKVIGLEAQVQTLALRYKPKHPRMIQAQRELTDLRDALARTAQSYPRSVQSAYDGALAREKQMAEVLAKAQQEALDVDQNAIQYNVLMREVQSDRALYDAVLRRLKETDLIKGWTRQAISIAEAAALPLAPAGPSKILVAAVGGLMAMFGSVGLLYLLRMMGRRIRTVDEAEEILGLPVVAAVQKARKPIGAKPRLMLTSAPDSPCAEAFRSLRTATQLAAKRDSPEIVLFTSAVPGEGKTFCSVNLSLSLAMEGKRTLLLDMDLRRPAVAESFAIKAQAPGLGDYLQGRKKLAELVHTTEYANLFVLPGGTPVTPEALTRDMLYSLISEAGKHFDAIVMDSAPVNAVSDTFLLLPYAHFTFLVVRAGDTPRRAVERAVELMARAHHAPSGVVLNYLPSHAGYGYYYHYAQKYEYNGRGRRKALTAGPQAVKA